MNSCLSPLNLSQLVDVILLAGLSEWGFWGSVRCLSLEHGCYGCSFFILSNRDLVSYRIDDDINSLIKVKGGAIKLLTRPLIIFLDNLSTISEILSNLILSIACDHGTFWNILYHMTHCGAVLRTCSFNLADWYSDCASHASLVFTSCSVIYILAHVVVSSLFCSLGIPPWSPQRNDL